MRMRNAVVPLIDVVSRPEGRGRFPYCVSVWLEQLVRWVSLSQLDPPATAEAKACVPLAVFRIGVRRSSNQVSVPKQRLCYSECAPTSAYQNSFGRLA